MANRNVAEFVAGVAKAYSTSSAYTDFVNGIAKQGNVLGPIQAARAALTAV